MSDRQPVAVRDPLCFTMAIKRWSPSQIISRQKFILGRLKRNGQLYAFLRQHRDQLFDDAFPCQDPGPGIPECRERADGEDCTIKATGASRRPVFAANVGCLD